MFKKSTSNRGICKELVALKEKVIEMTFLGGYNSSFAVISMRNRTHWEYIYTNTIFYETKTNLPLGNLFYATF